MPGLIVNVYIMALSGWESVRVETLMSINYFKLFNARTHARTALVNRFNTSSAVGFFSYLAPTTIYPTTAWQRRYIPITASQIPATQLQQRKCKANCTSLALSEGNPLYFKGLLYIENNIGVWVNWIRNVYPFRTGSGIKPIHGKSWGIVGLRVVCGCPYIHFYKQR